MPVVDEQGGAQGGAAEGRTPEEKLSDAPQRSQPSVMQRAKSSVGVKRSLPSARFELTGHTGS